MKQLSTSALPEITGLSVLKPAVQKLALPEKVLQFGTGVLLRGLPDYFIDKANRKNIFNGKVVLVKSTATGSADAFTEQDGLYTICVRGIEAGEAISENIINSSISRVISANTDWQNVLACAANPELKVIISNTTEVGITLGNDTIVDSPPASFPGKLLAFLHERFRIFGNSAEHGFVIIPTELIPDNGQQLKSIVVELAQRNTLSEQFMQWLRTANYFCNSLVDRIVPGKLPQRMQQPLEQELGYTDKLMILCEPYKLWAIETTEKAVQDIITFSLADDGVKLVPDLYTYRELKLRLLNGTHSFSCGLAYLSGFRTVVQAMKSSWFVEYVKGLMTEEIVPCILGNGISKDEALDFARSTVDRFRNPHIEHLWLSISLQYSSKILMRNIPLIIRYYDIYGIAPQRMTKGFAAYLKFMQPKNINGKFFGTYGGDQYPIEDIHAEYFANLWQEKETALGRILSNTQLWNRDLSLLPGFQEAIEKELDLLNTTGNDHANISR